MFEVVKGSSTDITVSSISWNDDKTAAQLTLASKIGEGKYTVTVTGIAEEALTGSVETQAETVDSIELKDEAVISGTDLNVGYKVLNQYGEDITAKVSASDLSASATNGGSVTLTPSSSLATIDNSTNVLSSGDKVTLTIVHDETGVVANKQLTVSDEAGVAEVSLGKVYNENGLELSEDNTTGEDFYVLVDAEDQYGNALAAADLNGSTVITSSKSDVLTAHSNGFVDIKVDGKTVTALQLDAASMTEGKATITVVSLLNGSTVQKEFEVLAATKVDTITLEQPDLAVAKEKVLIPFEATNNYGETVTDLSKLRNGVNVTGGTAVFIKNASTGDVELELDLSSVTAAGKVTLVATTGTNKVTTLTIDVKDPFEPVSITGLKDINLNRVEGKKVDISYKNLVLVDQYERTISESNLASLIQNDGYYIEVESDDTAVVDFDTGSATSTIEYDSGATAFVDSSLNAKAKGTANVTFTLFDSAGDKVADSTYEINVRVAQQSEFVDFEVSDIETVYDDSETSAGTGEYVRSLEVYGVLANGTKVVLPKDAYNVAISGQVGVDATADTNAWDIDVKSVASPGDDSPIKYASGETEATAKAIVTINDTGDQIEKDFTISKKAPTLEEINFTSSVVNNGYDLGTTATKLEASDIEGLLELTDSYGEDVTNTTSGTVTFADGNTTSLVYTASDIVDANTATTIAVSNNGTSSLEVDDIESGDSFTVTVRAANGVKGLFNVVKN